MKDLTNKSLKELIKLVREKQDALKDFRFGSAGSKAKNVKEGRGIRKDIARIMTAMTQVSKSESAKTAKTQA